MFAAAPWVGKPNAVNVAKITQPRRVAIERFINSFLLCQSAADLRWQVSRVKLRYPSSGGTNAIAIVQQRGRGLDNLRRILFAGPVRGKFAVAELSIEAKLKSRRECNTAHGFAPKCPLAPKV